MMREEDKRHFKRYKSESECEVVLLSGTYKGRIIDYSDGIGIEYENIPDLKEGAEIDIRACDHDLSCKGTVAWAGRAGQHERAGIRRTDVFKGNLRDFRFADILIGINRSGWTGVLNIKRGSTIRNIFIDKGDIIFASSNDKDDRLGERLMKKGKITLSELENASYLLMKTGKKLGKILVELGYLSPSELFTAVRQQIEDIIISHFQWEDGEFEFKEGPITSNEVITLQISMANIIYRGTKKIDNFKLIQQMCPSAEDILNPSRNPMRIFQSLNLDNTDKKILSYINGLYPLKTILSLSPASNFETLKTLSALMSIGLIYVKGEGDVSATLPIEEIFGEAEEIAPQAFLQKIEEVFQRCACGGYYEALGVARDESTEGLQMAYFQLLRQFHPDRHFSFPSLDIKDKLLKIISYTTEGYEILSDPNKRREYDKALMTGDSPGMGEGARTSSPPQDIRKMEQHDPLAEDGTKETVRIELPEDYVKPATQEDTAGTKAVEGEDVPGYAPDHEGQYGSNGGNEEPEDTSIPGDHAQNTEATDNSGGNGHKEAERIDIPGDKMSCGTRKDMGALSETQLSGGLTSPPPDWVLDSSFRTPEEDALHNEIEDISRKINELQQERNELEQRTEEAGTIRALLYEQGEALELAVRDALTVLGFSARPCKESDSGFDIIFESPEGRCLGNLEGKDDVAISIERFSQLERNLQEDFAREGVEEYAKGVLFGNVDRLKPLADRAEAFTVKCIKAAKRARVALVRTADLFGPVRYLRSHTDPDYAKLCREAILNAEGDVVAFPQPVAGDIVHRAG